MNFNSKSTAAVVSSVLGIGCILYYMAVVFKYDKYKELSGAVVMFYEMVFLLLTGFALAIFRTTRPAGQGVLIGAAITLVIGYGICSTV